MCLFIILNYPVARYLVSDTTTHTFGSLVERPGGCPARLTQARKTNLRGEAAHAARWGGTGRAPSNPPALGLGFDAWGHSRETRELAGAVGEGATPCTDGRPPENTPAWIASHQSSLPNAPKDIHLENLENLV